MTGQRYECWIHAFLRSGVALMRPIPRVGVTLKTAILYSNRSTAAQHGVRDNRETAVRLLCSTETGHRPTAGGRWQQRSGGRRNTWFSGARQNVWKKQNERETWQKNIIQTVLNKRARVLRLAETGRPCYGDSTAAAKEAMSARRRWHGTTTAMAAGSGPRQRCWRRARTISRKK